MMASRALRWTAPLVGALLIVTGCSSGGGDTTPSPTQLNLTEQISVPKVADKTASPLFVADAGNGDLWYSLQATGQELNAGDFPRFPLNTLGVTAIGSVTGKEAVNTEVPSSIGTGSSWDVITVGDTAYFAFLGSNGDPGFIVSARNPGSPQLSLVTKFPTGKDGPNPGQPYDLATDGTHLYVADVANDAVLKLTTSGDLVQKYLVLNTNGQTGLVGVQVSSDGKTVYALGSQSGQIYSFDAESGDAKLSKQLPDGIAPVAMTPEVDGDFFFIYSNPISNATTPPSPSGTANKNGFGKVDAALSNVETYPLGDDDSLFGIALSANKEKVWATIANQAEVASINTKSPGTVSRFGLGGANSGPYGIIGVGDAMWFAAQNAGFVGAFSAK